MISKSIASFISFIVIGVLCIANSNIIHNSVGLSRVPLTNKNIKSVSSTSAKAKEKTQSDNYLVNTKNDLEAFLFQLQSNISTLTQDIFTNLKGNVSLRVNSNGYSYTNPNDKRFIDLIDCQNKEALTILERILSTKDGWEFVTNRDGVVVERRYMSSGSFVSPEDAAKGSKHACVKSSGIINAPPEAVFKLFLDNTRVREYNEHCINIKDVLYLPRIVGNQWSKLVWASGPKYGPFKARDFFSVVNYIQYSNGTSLILNRPAYRDDYKPSSKFIRATVLLAGNVIAPYGKDQTYLTQVAHLNPGGGADTKAAAWIINKLCAVGPPGFIRKLERAAQKPI
eukprot:gene7752-10530_t